MTLDWTAALPPAQGNAKSNKAVRLEEDTHAALTELARHFGVTRTALARALIMTAFNETQAKESE